MVYGPDVTPALGSPDTFECAMAADQRYPDDVAQWPENARKASDAAIQRLLADHPGAEVIKDTGECIDKTHPRFPDGYSAEFCLVRTVQLKMAVAPEPAPAYSPRERLRAFEDEKLGADCVRMNDAIEKGIGSMFQRLSEEDRAKHAALERLIVAHDKLDVAAAALGEAEMEAANAEMAVENA